MIDIEVVDNFFPPSYFERMQEIILGDGMEWNFRKDITLQSDANNSLFDYGFNVHLFSDYEGERSFNEKTMTHFLGPAVFMMQDFTGEETTYRARLDMTVYAGDKLHMHPPHVDLPTRNTTAILYFNEADGPTVIFNERAINVDDMDKRERSINSDFLRLKYGEYDYDKLTVKKKIDPKPNRVLFFAGDHVHTGHSPTNVKNRVLLNCNFGPKKVLELSSSMPPHM